MLALALGCLIGGACLMQRPERGVGIALVVTGCVLCCCGFEPCLAVCDAVGPGCASSSRSSARLAVSLPLAADTVPIIYSDEYNIEACGLEKLHPFDTAKYRHIVGELSQTLAGYGLRLVKPRPASMADLALVHSPGYLGWLRAPCALARIVEVPLVACVPPWLSREILVEPMRWQTGGSVLAARLALLGPRGWAINVGGGFHHAHGTGGSGFCIYADISLAIQHVRRDYPELVQRTMIVDLDAHQGNGHERDFIDDASVFIFDAYNPAIFPGDGVAARAIGEAMLTRTGTPLARDKEYLRTLKERIPACLNEFAPQLVLYNAGTDCLEDDPLGRMDLSEAAVIARDAIVFGACFAADIPIVMVLSGGYQKRTAGLIARSIENLDASLQLLTRYRPSSGSNSDGLGRSSSTG